MSHVDFHFGFLCRWRTGTKQHPTRRGISEDPPSQVRGSWTFWDLHVLGTEVTSNRSSRLEVAIIWEYNDGMTKSVRWFLSGQSRGGLVLFAAWDCITGHPCLCIENTSASSAFCFWALFQSPEDECTLSSGTTSRAESLCWWTHKLELCLRSPQLQTAHHWRRWTEG